MLAGGAQSLVGRSSSPTHGQALGSRSEQSGKPFARLALRGVCCMLLGISWIQVVRSSSLTHLGPAGRDLQGAIIHNAISCSAWMGIRYPACNPGTPVSPGSDGIAHNRYGNSRFGGFLS